MSDMNQTPSHKGDMAAKAPSFYAKIKEAWNKMSDDDVKLYNTSRDKFFALLNEKHHVNKEEAERKIAEFQKTMSATNDKDKTGKATAA
jgi:uncharacterized protein YjbJ (UPF0337 family)